MESPKSKLACLAIVSGQLIHGREGALISRNDEALGKTEIVHKKGRKGIDLERYKEMDISILRAEQQEVFKMALSGKSQSEIARELNCSRQNISVKIQTYCSILDGSTKVLQKKEKVQSAERSHLNNVKSYRKINTFLFGDLSCLANRERQVVELIISGIKPIEIAKNLELSVGTVYVYLSNAQKKIQGEEVSPSSKKYRKEYYQKNKDKICEVQKEYYQKNKDKYHEYQKEYYQKNKDKAGQL